MTWIELLDRAEAAGLLDDPELDDPEDPSTVDLAGLCGICGSPVDPATGVCGQGHDDLDRADAAALLARAGLALGRAEAAVAALTAAAG